LATTGLEQSTPVLYPQLAGSSEEGETAAIVVLMVIAIKVMTKGIAPDGRSHSPIGGSA